MVKMSVLCKTYQRHAHKKLLKRFMSCKQNLPRLPPPVLRDTMDDFVKNARALLAPTELQRTLRLTEEYCKDKGDGQILQEHLIKRAHSHASWQCDYIQKENFLQNRLPLPIYQTAAVVFPAMPFATQQDYLMFAAKMIAGAVAGKDMIEDPNLPADTFGGSEIDMSQHDTRFRQVRVVRPVEDCIETYDLKDDTRRHVNVMHNNQIFKLNVYDSRWRPYNEGELYSALKEITSVSHSIELPVGILTGINRDDWWEAHTLLSKDENNKKSLDVAQKAFFTVCLDNETASTKADVAEMGHQFMHGGGSAKQSGNRWNDSDLQFIVGRSGRAGATIGQTIGSGFPVMAVTQKMVDYIMNGVFLGLQSKVVPEVEKLSFNLCEKSEELIRRGAEYFDRLIEDYDMSCVSFKGFGLDYMRSRSLSFDSTFQIAVQLALYRVFGEGGLDLQYVSARKFYKARSFLVRTCIPETLEFCKIMCSSKSTKESRIKAFKETMTAREASITSASVNGFSYRDQQAFHSAARELNMNPQLFQDPGYKKLTTLRSRSNQLRSSADVYFMYSFHPAKFGIGYLPRAEQINIVVNRWKSESDVSAEQVSSEILQSLQDVSQLIDTTASKL